MEGDLLLIMTTEESAAKMVSAKKPIFFVAPDQANEDKGKA